MVETAPAPPFVVIEADLVLEFLEIPFDAPSQFGPCDEVGHGDVGWLGGKPVVVGLFQSFRPFDQEPFLRPGLRALVIPMGGPHAEGGEPGTELAFGSFGPRDVLPGLWRQRLRQVLDAAGLVVLVPP